MTLYPEWLETDGLGGFAMGSIDGIPRRRYHSLLIASLRPPVERMNLINAVEVFIDVDREHYPLSSFNYSPGVIHPPVGHRVTTFDTQAPLPTWKHELSEGLEIRSSLFMSREYPGTYLSWTLASKKEGVKLRVRPLLSCRNYHWLNKANEFFRFDSQVDGEKVVWRPYETVPNIVARSNGSFTFKPAWYYNFFYEEESARGFDPTEDLGSPGEFSWDLEQGNEAMLFFGVEGSAGEEFCRKTGQIAKAVSTARRNEEKLRNSKTSALEKAVDAYIVARGDAKTIIAGYPWFTDWGRDTFISIRGLCIETGRLQEAESILLAWTGAMQDGMIPNCFPDLGEEPSFNSVDASLWFVVAAYEFLEKAQELKYTLKKATKTALEGAIMSVVENYYNGTRFYIKVDEEDGLLVAGSYGTQLTWMDAKYDGYAFTPRAGKPVEIQALWINALQIASTLDRRWAKPAKQAAASFEERFWDETQACLFDVVDVNGAKQIADPRVRPNQIFAVGGLPFPVLKGEKAASVVAKVQEQLVTSIGLRSLAPGENEYKGRYEGGEYERCTQYHQGTVWTWLAGPFIEAWLRVRRSTIKARKEARELFFEPLMLHVGEAGLGHLPEIADGDEPHHPRGCPFQAWSVAEALRVELNVLKAAPGSKTTNGKKKSQ